MVDFKAKRYDFNAANFYILTNDNVHYKRNELELKFFRNLCDTKSMGKLNSEQFALAMYLIQQKLKGIDPPATLTPEMVPPSMRSKSATDTASFGVAVSVILNVYDACILCWLIYRFWESCTTGTLRSVPAEAKGNPPPGRYNRNHGSEHSIQIDVILVLQ